MRSSCWGGSSQWEPQWATALRSSVHSYIRAKVGLWLGWTYLSGALNPSQISSLFRRSTAARTRRATMLHRRLAAACLLLSLALAAAHARQAPLPSSCCCIKPALLAPMNSNMCIQADRASVIPLPRRLLAQWPPPKGDCRLNPARADCVKSTLGGVLAPKAKLKIGQVDSCPLCVLCGRDNMKGTQFCTDFCVNNCTTAGSATATIAGSAVAVG